MKEFPYKHKILSNDNSVGTIDACNYHSYMGTMRCPLFLMKHEINKNERVQ